MKIILLLILSLPLFSYSQTGPGGIGTNDGTSFLKIWYRPELGISTTGTSVDSWLNGAGITAHNLAASGTNRPTLISSSVNGNDEISFDGNDFLQITGILSTTNFITDQASSFLVTQRNSTTNSLVYSTYPLTPNRFTCHISWSNGTVYFDIGDVSRLQVPGLTGLNNYSFWSYDAINSSGKQLYRNGLLLVDKPNTTLYNSHGSQSFRIGWSLNGNITEIIIYKEKINTAQRIIIENYLSAKYNIASSANDLYDNDNISNGDYDFDVAGIGRIDASDLHNDAQGTGIVRILNPTGLDDDEFLIWGHDNGVQQATETTDIPVSIQARLDRVWRVSEVNTSSSAVDVGNIDLRFDLTGLGSVTASDLRLLIDTDNDGLFADETPISGATSIGGNVYQFATVSSIANNLRFTLGTINTNQTPLPIELLNFNAKVIDNEFVKLDWQTVSEINNDFYTAERSQNGIDWVEIITIDGAGNSSSILNYTTNDSNPFLGLSYYRLKQTDFDGKFSYSHIKSVDFNNLRNNQIEIYPNPTENQITVIGNESELETLIIYNLLGQDVTNKTIIQRLNKKVIINLNKLSEGTYYIKTKTTANKVYKQ